MLENKNPRVLGICNPYGVSMFFSGLRIVFRSHIHEYIPGYAEESGMRIMIHSPYARPDEALDDLHVSPGKSTTIRIRRV